MFSEIRGTSCLLWKNVYPPGHPGWKTGLCLSFPSYIHSQPATSCLCGLVNISQAQILFPFLISLVRLFPSSMWTMHDFLMPDFVHCPPCPALHPHPFPACLQSAFSKTSDCAAFLPKAFLEVSPFMSKINLPFFN